MEKYIIGIDVGGTTIKFGIFNAKDLKMVDHFAIPSPQSSGEEFIKLIYDEIVLYNKKRRYDFRRIIGIGIAVPCPIKDGYVEKCANLNLNDINLEAEMRKYIPKDVIVSISNDANMAAFGENASLDQPHKNAVLITLGTGVGGGIIMNGNIFEGSTGFGGEIGHIRVSDDTKTTCGCGSKGCLEQVCGIGGIVDYTKEQLKTRNSVLGIEHLSVKKIFDAAKDGDEVALETVHRVAKNVAIAASIIAIIIEPEIFIIGGGVSKAGVFLLDLIKKYYQEYARFSTGKIEFRLATTGNDAGMIGSALLIHNIATLSH